MAVSLKPSLSVVLAVSMVLLIAVIATLVIIGFPRFGKVQTKIDALNSTVRENVTNVRVVKSFVREEYEIEKFEKANSELKDAGMSAMKIMLFISPIMTIFMYGTIIAIIWFGHGTILDEIHLATGMKVGDLSAFITYVRQILSSLMMVTFLIMVASRAIASAKRIGEVLDEKVDLTDENAAYPEAKIQRGEIEFCGVSFRYYKNNQQKVLDNINLKIEPGATVGIIGSTGCGKTTLVSMIPRLYDVDEGAVLIDGINVKDYSLFNLREGVGMVLQKNLLFSGTISENLRWGDFDATDEELKKYSEYAAADKFISTFGDGYETLLSTDMLPTLTPEMLDDVRKRWSEPVNAWTVGKIADDYIWNMVCELPAKEVPRFTIGNKYTLHLPWSDVESVDARLRYINTGIDEERVLLVFECSYMVSELAAVREQPITIELARYTGMQLSESAFTRNICTVSVPEDTIASDSDIVEIVPEEKKEEEAGNTTAATTAPTTAPTTVPTTASTQPADTAQPDDTAASAETNAGEGSAEQQPEQPKKPKMVKVRKWCDGVYIVWGNEVIFKRVEVIYRKDGKMICTTKAGDNSWIKLYDQVATDTRGLYDGKIFGGTV